MSGEWPSPATLLAFRRVAHEPHLTCLRQRRIAQHPYSAQEEQCLAEHYATDVHCSEECRFQVENGSDQAARRGCCGSLEALDDDAAQQNVFIEFFQV